MLSGSGWWRTRYDFILQAGGILHGPTEELFPMGEAFHNSVHDIEAMNVNQLADLQVFQRDSFYYEDADMVIEKIMDAARRAWQIANT